VKYAETKYVIGWGAGEQPLPGCQAHQMRWIVMAMVMISRNSDKKLVQPCPVCEGEP